MGLVLSSVRRIRQCCHVVLARGDKGALITQWVAPIGQVVEFNSVLKMSGRRSAIL